MRGWGAVLAAMGVGLGACSQSAGGPLPESEPLSCAIGGIPKFESVCSVERDVAGDTLFLVVRNPDGGFRRFEVLPDGKGISPADGTQTAEVTTKGEVVTVKIDEDLYQIPAVLMRRADKP